MANRHRIGFVSTRFAGTDGVSLETVKWANVLDGLGYECFFFAGESDWPAARSYVVPEAHFDHPEIRALTRDLFDDYRRMPATSEQIRKLKDFLKGHLHDFLRRFDINLLIAENALSLPMNVPLGLALTELIAETCQPTIAHHHDFTWERVRYSVGAADDFLQAAFPSTLEHIRHVVINTVASQQLGLRTGASSTIIPNVMDFDVLPPGPDEVAESLRTELGIPAGAHLLVQPTRIVPRKQIEKAIELVRRLDVNSVLLVTHEAGDEGLGYERYLKSYARLLDAPVLFAAERFNHERGRDQHGRQVFGLADAYNAADLVTYPSRVEGFGNGFLEAVYYRRPIVASTYKIFKTDIQPKGFHFIPFEDFIDETTVQQVHHMLHNPGAVAEMVEANFALGKKYFSYQVLQQKLDILVSDVLGGQTLCR